MPDNLLPEIKKRFTAADRLLAGTQQRLQRDVVGIFERFAKLVNRYAKAPEFVSPNEAARLADAIKVRADLLDLLSESGFSDFISTYAETFPAVARNALEQFATFNEQTILSGVSAQALEAYAAQQTFLMQNLVNNQVVEPLMQQLFSGIIADTTPETLIRNIESVTSSLSTAQVETLVSDSLTQFNRITTRLKADELGFELYIYLGPQDDRTSEQCQAIFDEAPYGVPGLWKKEDINAGMVEGLDGDPFVMGGHWNCRHEFRPIDLQSAIELGFKDEA